MEIENNYPVPREVTGFVEISGFIIMYKYISLIVRILGLGCVLGNADAIAWHL